AVAAYADEVVGRVSTSGAQTVDAIRAQGNSVADQLAHASETTRGAVAEYADDVVARISASGEQAVAAIRFHGDSIADRLFFSFFAAGAAAGGTTRANARP